MAYTPICGIYLIRCVASGRVYVGQSVKIPARWEQHRRELRNGTHKNAILLASYRKYGPQSLEFVIVHRCDAREDLEALERQQIEQHRVSLGAEFVMNFGDDVRNPMKGRRHSAEARRAMSLRRLGKKRPPRSAEWCLAISASKRGLRQSPESVARRAAKMRGRPRSRDAIERAAAKHRGMKRSEETRRLLSAQRAGRRLTPEWKQHIREAMRRRVIGPEHRAKIAAALRARAERVRAAVLP